MNAVSYEHLTIGATAVGLAAATLRPSGKSPAKMVMGVLETADVRYCYDGTTPTASVGHLLSAGQPFVLEGESNLARLLFIRTGGTSGKLGLSAHDGLVAPGKQLQGGVFGRAVAGADEKAVGAQAAYLKTDVGAKTLLGGVGYDRVVVVGVNVTEIFANGNGAQTTFEIGSGADADLLAATTAFASKAAGTLLTYVGVLPAGEALTVTAVAATGTGTGAITVTASAVVAS